LPKYWIWNAYICTHDSLFAKILAIISKKKFPYRISDKLRRFLHKYGKEIAIPLQYQDLTRYTSAITLYDRRGEDTLWLSVYYSQSDQEYIFGSLKLIYAILKIDGNISLIDHLMVDRIDVCTYGNTRPYRVRIVNKINDNFDYFYVKIADASRIYGLELEDIMSPNRVRYLVHKDTLIEEHIIGIPGDQFIKNHVEMGEVNKIRLAKEFIKFNERCFVRLLGDMHSSNFVVDTTPDFEEMHYRIRSIDFDQQSYEGRKNVYLPQYYKQNKAILEIGFEVLTYESVRQYQLEERTLIANRLRASRYLLRDIMGAMIPDEIAPISHVINLKEELAQHYQNAKFLRASSMGDVLKESLKQLFR
jgi:hypothetical protein